MRLRISDFGLRIGSRQAPALVAMAMLLLFVTSVARAASVYDEVVARIFEARCVECHGPDKQKAKLALNTWETAARGSDGGPIWVAGKPADSVLLQRMRLPVDDEEHMPPKDRPQPAAEELALIEQWIERGASRSAAVGDLALSDALKRAVSELPAKLAAVAVPAHAEPLWELDAAAVAKVRAPLAVAVKELQQRFPGALSYESRTSPALHFTAVGLGKAFGDAELKALGRLGNELVMLDVSGTAITDASATVLASFAKLRVLRLSETAVTDRTVSALATLSKLETLSLHGTAISPACVPELAKLGALRKLYVAETGAAGAAKTAGLPVVRAAVDFTRVAPAEPVATGDSRAP